MTSLNVHFFDLETDRGVDLMDDATLDALYEAGCDDALVGHHRLAFARRADTLSEALKSAKADAESVPGVRVLSVKIAAGDIEAAPATNSAGSAVPTVDRGGTRVAGAR